MIRKLVVAMAAAGAIGSNSVLALGLGDITLHSALNQPLDAEIELLEVRDLERNEMLPNLAAQEAFARAGVERAFFLTDLKFETVSRVDGGAYVKVTSKKPVREPFLNFLMEVHWPSGRLLREYTLLLDPPAYAETQGRQAPAPLLSAPESRSSRVSRGPSAQSGQDYRVQANDTLWQIASRARPSNNVTVQQTMLAIQALNPDAFINGNINRLRKGAVLRLPAAGQVQQRSQGQAVNEVAQQNQQWQGQALDARVREQVKPVLPSEEGDGRLSILSAPAEDEKADDVSAEVSQTGATDGAEGRELDSLENELAISLENLDKVRRESGDLKERLGDLEGQIATLEKLVTFKDDQLAELQQQLAAQQAESDVAGESVLEPSSEDSVAAFENESAVEKVAPEDFVEMAGESSAEAAAEELAVDRAEVATDSESELTAETMPQATEVGSEESDAAEFEPVGYAEPTPAPSESELIESEVVEEPVEAVQEPSQQAEIVAEVVVEEEAIQAVEDVPVAEAEEESALDAILSNPLLLAGGGAAILLLALLIVRARRKPEEDESELDQSPAVSLEEPEAASATDDELFEAALDESDEVDGGEPETDFSELDELEKQLQLDSNLDESDVPSSTDAPADPLKEADIYVAYGRHDQAQALLEKAVAAEPERQDLRLKQLEVYAAVNDAAGFEAQAAQFEPVADLDAQMRITELRETLSGAETLAEDSAEKELDDLEFELDSDLDLDDELESDAELALDANEEAELDAEEPGSESIEFDLEDELSLEDASETDDELLSAVSDEDADLDFDTGLEEPAESSDSELEDFDEFDLSLSDEPETAPEEPELQVEAGEDDDELLAFDADLEDELELDAEFGLDEEAGTTDENGDLDEFDLSLSDEEVEQIEPDSELEIESLDESISFDAEESETELLVEDEDSLDSALELDAELEEDLELNEEEVAQAGLTADLDDVEILADTEVLAEGDATEEVAPDDTLPTGDLSDSEALDVTDESDSFETEEEDDDFELLSGTDEASTKLDLARAYIDMEDIEGAREILDEVLSEGTEEQKQDAQELIAKMS